MLKIIEAIKTRNVYCILSVSWVSLAVTFLFSYLCDSSLCCPVCSVVETRGGFKSIISLKRKEAFHFLQTTVKCLPDVLTLSCVFHLACLPSLSWRKTHYKQEQNALRGSWLISDLIWLFSENWLGIAEVPGGGIKDPTLPFAYFHTLIPFSFFPQPDIFVARTSGWSALTPCAASLLSFHT